MWYRNSTKILLKSEEMYKFVEVVICLLVEVDQAPASPQGYRDG